MMRHLVALGAAGVIAGCGSSNTTTTVISTDGRPPVASSTPPAPASSTTTGTATGPSDESGAGVRPRTLAEQLVAAATQYAGPYIALRHGQLRGVEYLGPDPAHPGWRTVLVTYTTAGHGRSGRGDTSADLLLSLARSRSGWTVVRAR